MESKNVLLIGGGGTLGTHTAKELLKLGHKVDVLCPEADEKTSWDKNLTYIKGLGTVETVKELFKNKYYNGIVNYIHYPVIEDYKPMHELIAGNTDHLIFLSSYRIYNQADGYTNEESPTLLDSSKDEEFLKDKTYYPLAKALGEKFLRSSGTTNWTAIRPVISFSQFRLDIVTRSGHDVLDCAKNGTALELPLAAKNLTAGLDWAGNSGKIIANLLFKKDALGQSFTISSAQNLTWQEVANIYTKLLGVKINWIDTEEYAAKYHKEDKYILAYDRLFNRKIDNSKVLKVTGLKKEDFASVKDGVIYELKQLGEI